jgi:hypothetical protein
VVTDFRADLPASTTADSGGSVSASLITGNLAVCTGLKWLAFCAVTSLGGLHAQGSDVTLGRSETVFHAAVGARYEIRPRLSNGTALVVAADALWNLTPVSLQLNSVEVWSSRTFAGTLTAGLAFDLL